MSSPEIATYIKLMHNVILRANSLYNTYNTDDNKLQEIMEQSQGMHCATKNRFW